jgi:transposase-like protein
MTVERPSKRRPGPRPKHDFAGMLAVVADYDNPAMTLDEVCEKHGVCKQTIYNYRDRLEKAKQPPSLESSEGCGSFLSNSHSSTEAA